VGNEGREALEKADSGGSTGCAHLALAYSRLGSRVASIDNDRVPASRAFAAERVPAERFVFTALTNTVMTANDDGEAERNPTRPWLAEELAAPWNVRRPGMSVEKPGSSSSRARSAGYQCATTNRLFPGAVGL